MLYPKGKDRKRTFEQVRREQTELGSVDYDAYDKQPKEAFTLHCNEATLECEFLPAITSIKGRPKCLIRVHGHSQNRLMSVRFIKVFQQMGYSAVIYDQRCFGESKGKMCTMGYTEKRDLLNIIDWVKQKSGEDTIIGVHGESMGAITALMALSIDSRIDFVVADSGGSDVYKGAVTQIKLMTHMPAFPALPLGYLWMRLQGLNIKKLRPIDDVAKTDKPILFIHGTADRDVDYHMSEEMLKSAKNPLSRLELFDGAGHCQSHMCDPVRYEKIVTGFVDAVENTLK
jgi:fermentation-respiration switch protein FrsA (DUF1100 family)